MANIVQIIMEVFGCFLSFSQTSKGFFIPVDFMSDIDGLLLKEAYLKS